MFWAKVSHSKSSMRPPTVRASPPRLPPQRPQYHQDDPKTTPGSLFNRFGEHFGLPNGVFWGHFWYKSRLFLCFLCFGFFFPHVLPCLLFVVCCLLFVGGCLVFVACCLLLLGCCFLLVSSCFLLVACCLLFVARCLLFVLRCLLFLFILVCCLLFL